MTVPRRPALPASPETVVLTAFESGTLHERTMLLLAATMGLRRTEIASLHPADRRERVIRVHGKNSTVRELTLDKLTYELLIQVEAEQGRDSYYFPGRFGGHVHPATVYKWLKPHLGPEWTLHSCRRRAATVGYRATKNVYAVQQFLGHSSVETTQIYVDVGAEDIAAVAAAASLVSARSTRHVAGLRPEERDDIDDKGEFLADLASLTSRARIYGLELTIR
ncbi:tyrosine-type recombinase/integrase [Agromyces mariniharenae]|uniref:Site-specific integrase n=1 Tax=Agromyces mariniharenae TaxID=2604423 RepID=A0A5S4V8K6_9MICO|nr:site-specific integrase [Agromyces mariniharenae]TYL50445.1 site-specific integrase [Agromyces mariniharenae]